MSGRRTGVASTLAALLAALAAPCAAWAADPGPAGRAADSLRAAFPGLAAAPRAPGAPAGAVVDEYVGADVAKLVGPGGRRSLLLSSMPMRSRVGDGSLQPLSLALRNGEPGEVRPQNPIAQVRIATDPAEGFTIGPDPRHLVTIVPLGLRADAPSATVFAGQMLFPGARESADLLIRPSATGVQTFEQLRSAAAPESFAYRLELSSGQTAALADGVVSIRQGGELIAQSVPPVAIDAEQRSVPVTISLTDDVIRLDVPHRQGGFVYPIAVDPDWTSTYDYHEQPGLGLEGWHAEGQVPETPPAYYNAAVNRNWDGTEAGREKLGFVIKPIALPGGRVFPTGVGAQLVFDAPGTTRIRSNTFRNVFRLNDRDRQTLRFVLRGESFRENNDVFEAQAESTDDVTLPSVPFAEDVQAPGTEAAMWMFSSPCVEGSDLNCPPVIDSDTSQTLLKVGSVDLVLTDFDFPTTRATGTLRDLQDRWTNVTDSRTLSPSAIDEGSGVRELSLSLDDPDGTTTVLRSIESPCHPDHDLPGQDNAICPRALSFDAPLRLDTSRLRDGRSTFTVDASDLADNTAAAGGAATAFSIYLDRREPTSSVSGPLFDAADSWARPGGPGRLTVTGTDTAGGEGRTSGIAHNQLTAVDRHGAAVLTRDADTCTPPGPIAAPCDPGKATTFTVNPQQLPEGPITFSAASRDLAGNDSRPVAWTVRLDRTPPVARASGDLLALTSRHTNSTTPTSVTLQGRDAASGVARLQLVASNSDGEKVLADRDTCTAGDVDATDGACPHDPSVEVTIDPGDLPDGPTTFVARAIDHAGIRSVDNQDWDTYVDHTPPDPPDSVSISQAGNTSVQITWPTVVDQPLGSGDVSYEYLITAGGQPIGGWRPTTNPHARVSDLPPGVTIRVQVRAIDRAHNIGGYAAATHALRSAPKFTVERIYRDLRLGEVGHEIEIASRRVVVSRATTGGLRATLRSLRTFLKKAPKGGVIELIGQLVEALVNPEVLNCDENEFMRRSGLDLVLGARASRAIGSARPGPNPKTAADAIEAIRKLQGRQALARKRADRPSKDCNPPAEVVLAVADRLLTALERGLVHLGALEAQPLDDLAEYQPSTDCKRARALVDRLGRGPGRRNYVVYWSPPPQGVEYVGISRALDRRCGAHPDDISDHLQTLSLPRLTRAQAHGVEEVLISHFGPFGELATVTGDPEAFTLAQLRNQIHSVSPVRQDYCQWLGFGQALLRFYFYSPYTKAIFTRGRRCPGII